MIVVDMRGNVFHCVASLCRPIPAWNVKFKRGMALRGEAGKVSRVVAFSRQSWAWQERPVLSQPYTSQQVAAGRERLVDIVYVQAGSSLVTSPGRKCPGLVLMRGL